MSELNTPNNFDLEQSIAGWRARLSEQQSGGVHDAAELEAHLRDGIAKMRSVGLSEEEAFYVSARRLGDPAALALEFAKVDPIGQWRMQLTWIAIGYVGTMVFGTVINAITFSVVVLMARQDLTIVTVRYLDPTLYCLGALAVAFVLYRSATPSGGREKTNRPAVWMRALRNYVAANPVRCVWNVFAVLFLSRVAQIGAVLFEANWRSNIGIIQEMAIPAVVMSLPPTLVMVAAVRGRKSPGAE